MAVDGFHPVAVPRPRGCDFVLGRCAFVEVAARDPDSVCQLHLGLVEEIAMALEKGAAVELAAKDPSRVGCRVRVRISEGAEQTLLRASRGKSRTA
jgi:predicted ArsR family transcriptional regulator